ncbi:hypothetical protein HaLaN_23555 [Haematococcus lacustris]|uniref:Uncharacterized protein n=1 Tax=Haematococcus lacustris TaxID=44745 RepID=A0A699ZWK4_HAELA|nr:hypothetical protein HaLaN_23555 [Haematococcus lacustris]
MHSSQPQLHGGSGRIPEVPSALSAQLSALDSRARAEAVVTPALRVVAAWALSLRASRAGSSRSSPCRQPGGGREAAVLAAGERQL